MPPRKSHLRVVSNNDRFEVPSITCHICDTSIDSTAPFFDVKLKITSGVNKALDGSKTSDQLEEDIDSLIDELSKRDKKSLEEEVCLERNFQVCPTCRKRILSMLNSE
ncbi:MAG: hypothetical protein HQM08_23850 [Candidatus Riflebacteria bacterium]|nr:hypothetical protein [Candidatus Riflebacteria bacterium]